MKTIFKILSGIILLLSTICILSLGIFLVSALDIVIGTGKFWIILITTSISGASLLVHFIEIMGMKKK